MFYHTQNLQFEAKPDGPDAAFARRFQEVLGGKWGEMTVANQYLYQGWNCRLPGKYKDMLLAIGTEEMAHVELICTMIARLLDDAPLSAQEAAVDGNPALAAVFGGSNPQQAIVTGGGAYPADSNGIPWSGAFITASGNLYADFHLNATAEMQGRLQVARLWNMTEDPGVRDTLRFLLARDHYHQMQWLRAIGDLEADGLDKLPVPDAFDVDQEAPVMDAAYQFIDCSDGTQAAEGSWVGTDAMDGSGRTFTAVRGEPSGDRAQLPPGDPRLYGTPSPDKAPKAS
ncbi:MAG: manganese catalase family protein, partial [Pseudonocardia sp.]|nr:manganese catalase family protein [Pseudonocardia sp.]